MARPPGKAVRPSRAEARLLRHAERDDRRRKKQVRQAQQVADPHKVVPPGVIPAPAKEPVIPKLKRQIDTLMEWTRDLEDRDDHWSWGPRDWGDENWRNVIHPYLEASSAKTWRQIRAEKYQGRAKHVKYQTSVICQEAYRRLRALDLDDQTHIFRFRLSARRRLYGFTFDHVFKTVWYDPEHNIYPTEIQSRNKPRLKQARCRAARQRQRQQQG